MDDYRYEIRIEMTPDFQHTIDIKKPYHWMLYRFYYDSDDTIKDCILINDGWSKNIDDAYELVRTNYFNIK